MRRFRWIGLTALCVFTVALVGGLSEAFRTGSTEPTADQLISALVAKGKTSPSYSAEISVGQGGTLRMCRQWCLSPDSFVFAVTDDFGFRHAERWQGSNWDYYQGGADLEVNVQVQHLRDNLFGRWIASGYPNLHDITSALASSTDRRLSESLNLKRGHTWVFDCKVPLPPEAAAEAKQSIYPVWFGKAWRVWIVESTGEVMHVTVDPDSAAPMRIGVENVRRGDPDVPEDWRTVVGRATVREHLSLTCDARSSRSIDIVRSTIKQRVHRWQSTLFKKYKDPPSGVPR